MTLLCDYHHRLLHEGGFSIVKKAGDTLRFITADGRTIPRAGYRLKDFVDDDIGGDADGGPSAEGFGTTPMQGFFESYRAVEQSVPSEVREPATVYRIA
jgi:hypothetical protein